MFFRQISKYATSAFVQSDLKGRSVLHLAGGFSMNPSRSRPMHLSSASNQSWGLRLEGIQGPLSALPSLKESRKILETAVKDANAGFSQQGVQGGLHTEETHYSSEDGAGRGRREKGGKMDHQMEDTACPQGVQGDIEDCSYFNTWLHNCQRYGLHDCNQQLQGIQSGRLTLAEVLADQEARIKEIAHNYRTRAQQRHPDAQHESMQGTQDQPDQLPQGEPPCPQGVQGDDCVRFRLWLETCQRFDLHECAEQLQGFQSGRATLQQIFEEQDAIINQVVEHYRKKQN